jgi:hypothetical protein
MGNRPKGLTRKIEEGNLSKNITKIIHICGYDMVYFRR